jgi:uncharacterized glyoxalase superfamily protein PhnB
MSERPIRPPQTPWLMPYLTVKDAEATLDFYQRAFGFEKKFAMTGPDGRVGHAEVIWNDAVIMFGPECASDPAVKAPSTLGIRSPVTLYLYCKDVDALHARATAAGAVSQQAPQDMFWGDRMCTLTDPDGHKWSFATFLGRSEQVSASA